MKSLITLFLVLGIFSFGFINEQQSLIQSFAFVFTGLFFLGLAAHLDERYQKRLQKQKSLP